jgi:hypothetical protein
MSSTSDTKNFKEAERAQQAEGGEEEKNKEKTVALVSEQIITTERPPLDGEVSANYCG